MILRRLVLILLFALSSTAVPLAAATDDATASAVTPVRDLCDSLIEAMKKGASLDYAGRVALLGPHIRNDFDLALMTRLIVGASWKSVPAADQESLLKAFSDYSVATYAQRFKSYSGERFEVDPNASPLARGDQVVHTKLFTGDPNPVQLDYLLRKTDAGWRIIDVFLSGTISELAARRSEYSAVLRQGGAPALAELLRKKTAEFGG